jgi:predicted Zn-dependent protease
MYQISACYSVAVRNQLWAVLSAALVVAAPARAATLLDIISQELARNFSVLKSQPDTPAYYVEYTVVEQEGHSIAASLGALQRASSGKNRYLDVTVRVGSSKLDNYHRIRGERPNFSSAVPISLDDNADAIRRQVWLVTDQAYRAGAQRLIRIKTNQEVKVAEEDTSDDFSAAEVSVHTSRPQPLKFPAQDWTERLRRLSIEFGKHTMFHSSGVSVSTQTETKSLVNTEGTHVQHGRGFARLMIVAQAKAADGMDLATSESFEAEDPARLPDDKTILAAIERVSSDLNGLLHAPVMDPFVGPAILSGRAAGVFFHEIFGHRIEGHRQKDETEGQTFTKSLGEKVLPDFLSVIFDPTIKRLEGTDLNGSYEFDDEGVKARRLPVVDKGVLKTFLMSRSPVSGAGASNGHGRRQPGAEIVARQSNLIVESANRVSEPRLREMLIEEVRRQNKPYGLYFRQVTGGYTTTGRAGLQAFKVIPVVVYRVYADGRVDQLVRGADIVGTPLASFAKILATSDKTEVFNGYCGAESGNVPVSAVAPAILISEIEVSKRQRSNDSPPILPRPFPQREQ